MREIPVTGSDRPALIDDADYPLVSQYRWRLRPGRNSVYAQANVWIEGKRTTMAMHRLILGAKGKRQVDHINRNPFDNQRHNLRLVTGAQNNANRRGWSSTGFKYVTKLGDRFRVVVARKHVGLFRCPTKAALAADAAALKAFGEYAALNFPQLAEHLEPVPF